MALVLLDPGHGGVDSGAIGDGLREKDVVLPLSFLIAGNLVWLSKGKVDTQFTRLTDKTLTVAERAEIEHELEPDLFVSVHCNSFTSSQPRGFEIYYYSEWSKGKRVAESIVEAIGSSFPTHGDGSKVNRRFYVLKHTRAPAILIEALYINNSKDRQLLKDFHARNLLAWMIAQGIWNALEI